MGDVAMTVPVIKNVLQQNPGISITVLSNFFYEPLFDGIEKCRFYPAYLRDKHKGLPGLAKLSRELRSKNEFDAIADLHSVLRSKIISGFFRLRKYSVAAIDKGRKEKEALTRKGNKVFRQLSSTHERYADVFREIGINVQLDTEKLVYEKLLYPDHLSTIFSSGKKIIGIAPFAQHAEKMYPLERTKEIVKYLVAQNMEVLLFGGGKNEEATLQEWEKEIPSSYAIAGRFSLKEELAIISNLHGMLSMDSANMHLASLYSVPVISVWGATHPFAGFYGWAQDKRNIIQVDLFCRPCSVFGNKPCYRGDHACMQMITNESIIQKILAL